MKPLDSIWSFLSVVIIAWTTQRIVSYFERRKKIADTKLAIYVSWIPFFADVYAGARFPSQARFEPREFFKKKVEILGLLQLMGPEGALDAFSEFTSMAEKAFKKDPTFDTDVLHHQFTELNYLLCCEIHGEIVRKRVMKRS